MNEHLTTIVTVAPRRSLILNEAIGFDEAAGRPLYRQRVAGPGEQVAVHPDEVSLLISGGYVVDPNVDAPALVLTQAGDPRGLGLVR